MNTSIINTPTIHINCNKCCVRNFSKPIDALSLTIDHNNDNDIIKNIINVNYITTVQVCDHNFTALQNVMINEKNGFRNYNNKFYNITNHNYAIVYGIFFVSPEYKSLNLIFYERYNFRRIPTVKTHPNCSV